MKRVTNRTAKLESLIGTPVFDGEIDKIRQLDEDEHSIRAVEICDRWQLAWECFDIIMHFIDENMWDFSVGDKDFRIIDYKNQKAYPAASAHNEFRIMKKLLSIQEPTGVYIKIPSDSTRDSLIDFIQANYKSIKKSLDDNHPDRVKNQRPDYHANRKARIYLQREQGVSVDKIAENENCEPAYVRRVFKEIKDLIIN